jgi:uncharacterized membrane protein
MTWRGVTTPLDRLYACLPYILPITTVSVFGFFLFQQFPLIKIPFIPFLHLNNFISRGILPGPIGELNLVFFIWFGIYIFVVRNQKLKHFIRFNAMQALMIGIGISLIIGILRLFNLTVVPAAEAIISGSGLRNIEFNNEFLILFIGTIATTFFFAATAMSLFSIFQSIRGKYGEVPIISEAAYNITR